MRKQFTLGKKERLKSRKQIEQLFSVGKKFSIAPFRIFFLTGSFNETEGFENNLKFGAGVSSRNFKKAVDRNRIKRLVREAWRLQKNELKDKLKASGKQIHVFFIYTAKELPEFNLVKDKVAVALKKLLEKTDENNSANS